MPKLNLLTFDDCRRETGYAVKTLRIYHRTGRFVEAAATVGNNLLFDPATVRRWRKAYLQTRSPRGAPPPRPK